MSHVKIHEHHQTMTRLEVAVELRRLATQLEWEKCIPYGDGTIAVPCKSSENSRSTSPSKVAHSR